MAGNFAKYQPAGFSNHIRRVAIVGAGGTVGKYIAQELLKTGKHTVTALTRPGSTSTVPEGVRRVEVDYDGDDDDDDGGGAGGGSRSLVRALEGQDFLVITLSVTTPADTHSKLVQAAAKAGVEYIMPNAWGADITNDRLVYSGLPWAKFRDSLAEIEATGASWIAMVCGFWYEHSMLIPDGFGFDLARKRLTLFDDGETKINVSTTAQCGRAVASLLSLKILPEDENDQSLTLSRWRNQHVFISSFLLSQKDMFESWKRVVGDTDDDWTTTYEPTADRFKQGMEAVAGGDPTKMAKAMYSRVFFPNGDGNYENKRGLANSPLGLPQEDLDEHTRNAKALLDRGYNYMSNRN